MEFINQWLTQEKINELTGLALSWGGKVLIALVIWVIGMIIIRKVASVAEKAVTKAGQDRILSNFIGNVTKGALMALLVLAILQQFGFPMASLLAALGAAGLAIGLALKDSLANLAAGVLLILFRPFKTGDYVNLNGSEGKVSEVKLFMTELHTLDNRVVTVPNNIAANNPITNFTKEQVRRVDLTVGVGYGALADDALAIIKKVVEADDMVLNDPAPLYVIEALNESSVDLGIRPWVKTGDYWPAHSELQRKIKIALDEAGVEIPFPQRTIHVVGDTPATLVASTPE